MPVEKERKHDSTTCVCNKCGIEGRENGRFAAAEREREGRGESYLEGEGMAIEDSFPTFSAWSRGGEKKAISYHNTLLIANCESVIVISILN